MLIYTVAYKMGKQRFTAQLALEHSGKAQSILEEHHRYSYDYPLGRKKLTVESTTPSVSLTA